MNHGPGARRLWAGVAVSGLVLAGFGASDSPYLRVGPGPMIGVGPTAGGSWSVTTVRVRDGTWFQWALARFTGERIVRRGGGSAPAPDRAMAASQTDAVLVAAQLAEGLTPVGTAGLQVTGVAGTSTGAGPRPGDVLLAAGDTRTLAPLRTRADLEAVTARSASLRVLLVPKTSAGSWAGARIERLTAASLRGVRAGPAVSAVAYPLGAVQGPSAGLILALARIDELTPGDLTGGRDIAGTGAIELDGAVTGVGEAAEKVRAAVAAGTDVFFVPVREYAVAVRAAGGAGPRIVPVRSVSDAVNWLCAHGGNASVC